MNDVFVMQYDYQCDKPNDLETEQGYANNKSNIQIYIL